LLIDMSHLAVKPRLSIALVTPLNPVPSGLADYSETLLPALAEHADVTVYSDCGTPSNSLIAERFIVRPVYMLQRHYAEHDLRLYQIGNSNHHAGAFDMLRHLPGVVTLHEPFLHVGFRTISAVRYERELAYELGYLSKADRLRWLAEEDREQLLAQAPLIGRVIDSSLSIIVHSQYARSRVQASLSRRGSLVEIAVIPQLMPLLPTGSAHEMRRQLDLPADRFTVGIIGGMAPAKEPYLILQAAAWVQAAQRDLQFVFVGECPPSYDLPNRAWQLGLSDQVRFLDRVEPLSQLHRVMLACDIILVLRRPTLGETSAIALRALAMGRPLIVRDVGWFSDLPSDAVVKLRSADGAEELAHEILALANAPEQCYQMGLAGRQYIQAECDVTAVARRYADFLQATWARVISARL
jgi:glycosyltransferase involved in cell wall biosynthesis